MGQWNRRVNEALDSLLAAQLAESALRKQIAEGGEPLVGAEQLERLRQKTSDEVAAARVRLDDVLWIGPLDEHHAGSDGVHEVHAAAVTVAKLVVRRAA